MRLCLIKPTLGLLTSAMPWMSSEEPFLLHPGWEAGRAGLSNQIGRHQMLQDICMQVSSPKSR